MGSGNTHASQAIIGQSCDYELATMGPSRGLKTDSVYKTASSPGSESWTTSQTDTYGYDAKLDYLLPATETALRTPAQPGAAMRRGTETTLYMTI